jgi:uncharacterized protein
MAITDVHLAVPASVGVEAGMVVLTEEQPPGRMLRIIIGQPEARAIMAAWQHSVPGRPSTWDLLLSTIDILGAHVDAVVITAVEEERHYYAVIELSQNDDLRALSCRPSDAIALAVRSYNAAVLAEESVLEAAGVLADGSRPPPKPGALPEADAALAVAGADGEGGADTPPPASKPSPEEVDRSSEEAEPSKTPEADSHPSSAAPAPSGGMPPPLPAPPASHVEPQPLEDRDGI